MKLSPIVLRLRLSDTRFGDQIAGASELQSAIDNSLKVDMAFVVQLSETSSENDNDFSVNQVVTEVFSVIVALANDSSDADKTGIIAYDSLEDTRTEIFRSLLGWSYGELEGPISYVGGELIEQNNSTLWYKFDFVTETRITDMIPDPANVSVIDDPVNGVGQFDTLYTQYLLSDNTDLEKAILAGVPVDESLLKVDMTQNLDFTTNPRNGAFGSGFVKAFKIDRN